MGRLEADSRRVRRLISLARACMVRARLTEENERVHGAECTGSRAAKIVDADQSVAKVIGIRILECARPLGILPNLVGGRRRAASAISRNNPASSLRRSYHRRVKLAKLWMRPMCCTCWNGEEVLIPRQFN